VVRPRAIRKLAARSATPSDQTAPVAEAGSLTGLGGGQTVRGSLSSLQF
jgi:hypothetical protein